MKYGGKHSMERECTAYLIVCSQDKQKQITAFTCYTGHLANSAPLPLKQWSSLPVTAVEAPDPGCRAERYTVSIVLGEESGGQRIRSTPPS